MMLLCWKSRVINQVALKLIENPLEQARSKHVNGDVTHHVVCGRVEQGDVFFSFGCTKENIADCLTELLSEKTFQELVKRMGCA
jgi:hypothetical protein